MLWPTYWTVNSDDDNHSVCSVSSSPIHSALEDSGVPKSFYVTKQKSKSLDRLMRPDVVLAQLAHNTCIILTFGLASPPLMLTVILTTMVTFVTWRIIIGRFLSVYKHERTVNTRNGNDQSRNHVVSIKVVDMLIKQSMSLQFIEKLLENVENAFDSVSGPLIWCSSIFVAFLCYDTVSSDPSSTMVSALIIPLAALFIPLLYHVCSYGFLNSN